MDRLFHHPGGGRGRPLPCGDVMSCTGGCKVRRKSGRKLVQPLAVGFGHQGRCLQGGDAKPQSTDILTQKTGAHFFRYSLATGRTPRAEKGSRETAEKSVSFL